VEDRYEALRHASPDQRYNELNESAKLKDNVESILEQAKELKKKAPPAKSKSDFKANKREKRQAEVTVQRAADTQDLTDIRLGSDVDTSSSTKQKQEVSPRKKAILQLVHNSLHGAGKNE
jgi:hypothetical protein